MKGEPWSGSSLPPPLPWSSPQTVMEIYWEHSLSDIWKLGYALQCHHKEHKKYKLRRFKQSFWNKNRSPFIFPSSVTYLPILIHYPNFINCCSSGSITQVTAELQRLYGHGSWKWLQVLPMAFWMDMEKISEDSEDGILIVFLKKSLPWSCMVRVFFLIFCKGCKANQRPVDPCQARRPMVFP